MPMVCRGYRTTQQVNDDDRRRSASDRLSFVIQGRLVAFLTAPTHSQYCTTVNDTQPPYPHTRTGTRPSLSMVIRSTNNSVTSNNHTRSLDGRQQTTFGRIGLSSSSLCPVRSSISYTPCCLDQPLVLLHETSIE
jgi:hypothetical protein